MSTGDRLRTPPQSAARPGEAGACDPCDVVIERVALGEPLGDLAEHAASCAKCRRVAALPAELGAARVEADPGLGFAARVTAGAQQRIVVRKRRRIAAAAVSAVAAGSLLTFALTRDPQPAASTGQPAADLTDPARDPLHDDSPAEDVPDDELRALVELADTARAQKLSANWRRIEAPLQPYRYVVQGVQP